MPKYRVSGPTMVWVETIVEAEDEDEAIEKAFEVEDCLTSFVGNNGCDKLVGVYDSNTSLQPSDVIEYETVEKIGD